MGEGLKRQLPQCTLPDAGKDHITKVLKADLHDTCDAIGHGQANRAKHQHRGPFFGQSIHRHPIKLRHAYGHQLRHKQSRHRQDHAGLNVAAPLGP